jgi:hypothetical protein|tara:strand:+ start:69 stop:383 length:315 start_codon:yes stop_codon:yes gene_type:complete
VRDFVVTKITNPSIPMDVNLIGISYIAKNELVILPAVPNVVIIENAIGPQEHAPAEAPIIVPIILEPIFLVSLISLTRKIFIDIANAERNDRIIINEKLSVVSG